MEQKYVKIVHDSFASLVEKYGFKKANEQNDGQSYSIEYHSDVFAIKLVSYRREFYATLYKTGGPDKGVNLFNLLSYLNQNSPNVPEEEYFSDETNLEECYRKQLTYISTVIDENFKAIKEFFNRENLASEFAGIRKYMLNKYPELFRRIND